MHETYTDNFRIAARVSWVAFGLLSSLFGHTALAQIVPDNSLESEASIVQTSVDVNGGPIELIQGGAIRGSNLFHSFSQFNVGDDQSAYFDHPDDVTLILSRVTGGNPSNILGTLGVLEGSADLFLINPAGIVFGPNASLDLNGSFLATTASDLIFEDGAQFSAINPTLSPLLTITGPVGLQFGETPGDIINQALVRQGPSMDPFDITFGLEVEPGNTLALIGGEVALEGGGLDVSDGHLEIGSVAGNNYVSLQTTSTGWSFNYEKVQEFEDIEFTNSIVSVPGFGEFPVASLVVVESDSNNATVDIQGRNILLTNASQVRNAGSNLTVTASETLKLAGFLEFPGPSGTVINRSGLLGSTFTEVNAGDITINTRRLVVRGGAFVVAESSISTIGDASMPASGQGGILSINALESVDVVDEDSRLSVSTQGLGDAGRLIINTGRLTARDGAEISTLSAGEDSFGQPLETGAGGDIFINADQSVDLINKGSVLTESRGQGGEAGDLNLSTRLLALRDGSALSAETDNNQGGNINLQVNDLLFLRGNSRISATAGTAQAGGDGGNVDIAANLIFAPPDENSDITANAFSGRGGRVEITSDNILGLTPLSREELQTLLGTDDPAGLDPSLLPSNDITAISQENPSLDGEVIISSPDLDLNRAAEE
ncbi:MAG: filamentous hemagglutinin N-terminal domain-containing protein, partial [Cyanobacteria bacterium P01_G01_bin.38]